MYTLFLFREACEATLELLGDGDADEATLKVGLVDLIVWASASTG
jgi:hypothetical protein